MVVPSAAFVMVVARADVVWEGDPRDYFGQLYGVTAIDENAALGLVQRDLEASGPFTFVRVHEIHLADFTGKDSDLCELRPVSEHPGVWYRSGRCWFNDGEEDVLDDFL